MEDRKAWNSTLRPFKKGTTAKEAALRRVAKASASKLKRSALKSKKKPTGEMKIFLKIYAEVNGMCELTGARLLPPGHEMFHHQFSHILPKGNYGRYRLLRENIVACLKPLHDLWESEKNKDNLAVIEPRWEPYCARYHILRLRYNTEKI